MQAVSSSFPSVSAFAISPIPATLFPKGFYIQEYRQVCGEIFRAMDKILTHFS
jgi:hypothetical protein